MRLEPLREVLTACWLVATLAPAATLADSSPPAARSVRIQLPVREQWRKSMPVWPMPPDWWAICRGDNLAGALVPMRLQLTPNPSGDANRRQCGKSYRIKLDGPCASEKIALLVRGLPGLARRTLVSHPQSEGNRFVSDVKPGDRLREIVVEPEEIVVRDGARVQRLRHSSMATRDLRWVGDLDGDGVLDFLLEEFDGTDQGLLTLYLSRGSPPGDLVHQAAALPGAGC